MIRAKTGRQTRALAASAALLAVSCAAPRNPSAPGATVLPSAAPAEPDEDDVAAQRRHKRAVMAELDRFPYRSPWWLSGPHAQTLYGALRSPRGVAMQRERWSTPDGDFIDVHLAVRGEDRDAPIALLLHGLEGSARSNYVRSLARTLHGSGWSVAALEFRSCGGELNRARRMYHSGETSDLDFVARRLLERLPARRLYAVGVSLGGNVLAKWLGELGAAAPARVAAAVVVCPPFDLTVSGPHIDGVLDGLYVRRFLRTLIPKALAKERQYPGCLDAAAVARARTFREFDDHATAPLHGFRDAQHYWESVSCGRFLGAIRRPTLLIASADDPFNPGSTLPREIAARSPYLHPQFTDTGGHVGFAQHWLPLCGRPWFEQQVVRFLRFYEELARGSAPASRRP